MGVRKMSRFYYDNEMAMVYKIGPVVASEVKKKDQDIPTAILVYTDIKITNFRREKIRRTLSEVYPLPDYDLETAKKAFIDNVLSRFLGEAEPISEEKYAALEKRLEPVSK